MMKLALRTKPASTAWNHRFANWIIKARLVTRYSHSGIVIGQTLYHSTVSDGPVKTDEWTPENWILIEVGGDDQRAIEAFESASKPPKGWFRKLIHKLTRGYDFASLLAFVGLPVRYSGASYCYELSKHMMTYKHPTDRVTVEDLLMLAIDMKGR